MTYHEIPEKDIFTHAKAVNCNCFPEVEWKSGRRVVVHNLVGTSKITVAIEIGLGIRCEGCGSFKDQHGQHIPPPAYTKEETTSE